MYLYIIFTMLTCKSWCMLKCSHFPWLVHWSLETFGLFVLQMRENCAGCPKKPDEVLGCWANNGRREWGASICFGHPPACLGHFRSRLGCRWTLLFREKWHKNLRLWQQNSAAAGFEIFTWQMDPWMFNCTCVRLLRGSNRMIHREVSILSYHHTFIWYHHRPPNTLK